MATFPDYAPMDANNLGLTARAAAVGTSQQFMTNWNPDLPEDLTDTFLIFLGPEDAGDSTQKKWWRGITVSGNGTATVMAYNFANLNVPTFLGEATFNMEDLGDQQNTFWFPRGTKGYFISALVMIQGRMDWCDLIYDTIGTALGAQ